jgi:hypothetical protein
VSFMINSLLRPELVADKMLTPRKAYFYNIIGLFPRCEFQRELCSWLFG